MATKKLPHKVQEVLTALGLSHVRFAASARCTRAVVTRAASGRWVHPKYVNRMVRAAGGLLVYEDFGPGDPELRRIRPLTRRTVSA